MQNASIMASLMFVKRVQLFLLVLFLLGGGRNSSLVCLFSTLLSSPLPHLPPAAARWGLIRGKVKWAAHLCESPMPLPLSEAYLGPFVWARHPVPHFTSPFQTFLFHVIPSLVLFPLLRAPPPHTHPGCPSLRSLSCSLYPSLLLWHIPAPLEEEEVENLSRAERERERERKNMRERKERREGGGGLSLWRMPSASSAVRGDPAGL